MKRIFYSNRHDGMVIAIGVIMIGIVTFADISLSGRVAVGWMQAVVILLGLVAADDAATFVLATVGSLATAAVGTFHVQEISPTGVVLDRGMSLILIWIVGGLVYGVRRLSTTKSPGRGTFRDADITRVIFDQTFQFVAVLDVDGNIVEANQTLRNFAGLTPSEIRAMTVWSLPIFQKDAAVRRRLQAAVATAVTGQFVRDEFDVSGVSNEFTVIDLSLKPIRGTDGAVVRIIMEARDVTDARVQQQMLTQAQKMEAVGELTAGVAHDFNNLLTVVMGNLELLEKHLKGDAKGQDRLARAIKAVGRGQTLTQQLLAFSRRQALHPVVLDVNKLLRGMSEILESLGDDLRIAYELADDLPLCEVDPTLLETALLNIAINARDAMPEGGDLRFRTTKAVFENTHRGEFTNLSAGNYVCIAISDTGEGIAEAIISRVSDPFFTTKSAENGTGLGLSMVYGFVKQSNGEVKIYSEQGKGTTVRLYLPETNKRLRDETPATIDHAAGAETRGKRVLLVEDDGDVRDIVFTALREMDCQVEAVPNGDSAMELIEAGSDFDLIFTDIVMAGDADGPDVARAARLADPSVPVIFCSGFPREALRGEDPLTDDTYFLGKPFQRDALIEMIGRALSTKQALAVRRKIESDGR